MTTSAVRALRDAVSANLAGVRERIARACARSRRDPASVSLVVVTKYGGPALVETLVELGQLDLGENRIDRILALAERTKGARWHMVGHLQRNKARRVAGVLAALHSLDSDDLARKLDARRAELALPALPCWLEVNVAGEDQKSGVAPAALEALAQATAPLPHLRIEGLMAMGPDGEDPEAARPIFGKLRELLPSLERVLGRKAPGLSMGMSHDLEVAVEEGATIVRIGRALLEGVAPETVEADQRELG